MPFEADDVDGSRGGWSETEAEAPGATPSAPTETRYVKNDLIGAGGMGAVHAVLDTWLGREVALKEVPLDRGTDDRLAREAAITSRLEHPGIVPVYDVGTTDAGRRYYTMRLVRGRSLASALARADGLAGRLALLPHLLDVCQAVAYAHSRGVIHRDLKPENVMVGTFGETLVVDWGLAGLTAEHALAELADDDRVAIDELLAARPAGTPRYVSPEQSTGAPPDPRADVFGLGAMLFELLTGRAPRPAGLDLASAAAHVPPDPQTIEPRAPLELGAVARRALSMAPEDRYASAAELAEELRRFLDGRRVLAHAYSPWELASRFVRTWRAPLSVAAAALLLLGVVGALALRASQNELAAEREARAALSEADATLTWALHGEAASRLRDGAYPEAALLAAHALGREESATTRGVLAAANAAIRPRFEALGELPEACEHVRLDADGSRFLCLERRRLTLRSTAAPDEILYERAGRVDEACALADHVAFVTPDRRLAVVSIASGEVVAELSDGSRLGIATDPHGRWLGASNGYGVTRLEGSRGAWAPEQRSCGSIRSHAFALSEDGAIAELCGDGRVVVRSPDGGDATAYASPYTSDAPAGALAFTRHGLVAGGLDGSLSFFDAATPETAPSRIGAGRSRVERIVPVGGDVVAVLRDRGGVELWDGGASAELGRLPEADRLDAASSSNAIVTAGARLRRWTVLPRVRALHSAHGFAHLTARPPHLAGARGDGHLVVWDLSAVTRVADVPLSERAVMWGAFAPDGATYLASIVDRSGLALLDTATWQRIRGSDLDRASRRVGFLDDGSAFAIYFGPGVKRWRPPLGPIETLEAPELRDAATARDGSRAVLLADDGTILELRARGAARTLSRVDGARAVATFADGRVLVGGHDLAVLDDGQTEGVASLPRAADVLDVALSPDERFTATALADGGILVHRVATWALAAELREHGDRVSALTFEGDATLVSASWDGTIRRWDLDALDADAARMATELEEQWGLQLREVLSAP